MHGEPRRLKRVTPRLIADARDLKYFFNGELIVVGTATVALTVIELSLLPSEWPFADWVDDWRTVLAAIALVAMIVAPAIARGRQHLRTRERYNRRSGAESFAFESLQGRASNLIAKVHQVAEGERTKEYLAHTVTACHTYFRGRMFSGDKEVDSRHARVDVVYYKRSDRVQTQMFEKQKVNDGSVARFKATVSSRQGDIARGVIGDVNGKRTLAAEDFDIWSKVFLEDDGGYVTGVGVPVLSSRKDEAETIGVLIVVATAKEALHESDREYLTTVGWLVSASFAIEALPINP